MSVCIANNRPYLGSGEKFSGGVDPSAFQGPIPWTLIPPSRKAAGEPRQAKKPQQAKTLAQEGPDPKPVPRQQMPVYLCPACSSRSWSRGKNKRKCMAKDCGKFFKIIKGVPIETAPRAKPSGLEFRAAHLMKLNEERSPEERREMGRRAARTRLATQPSETRSRAASERNKRRYAAMTPEQRREFFAAKIAKATAAITPEQRKAWSSRGGRTAHKNRQERLEKEKT